MNKLLLLLFCLTILQTSCNNKPAKTETEDNLDTLVSDHFLDDSEYTAEAEEEEPTVEEVHAKPAPQSPTSYVGNGGGGSDSDFFVNKYQNFERMGNHPDNFAEAMIYPAIRMVYSDNFLNPKARVLNSTMEGEQHIIDMAITWKDNWVSNYEIQGQLKVNTDGSDPAFTITEKNVEVEALEFTEDAFKNEITLEAI